MARGLSRGLSSGLLCGLALAAAWTSVRAADAPAAAAAPMFVHQSDRLFVPADSPLRQRLVVAPVAAATGPHVLSVPAVIEANPARAVSVLPPLAGRLIELKVGLGDVVRRGAVLAVIGSPDLAQARSDVDKSADALALARRALERAQGVQQAGANATKDLEAAQSGFNQAQAEDQRARARLKTLTGSEDAGPRTSNLVVTAPIAGAVTALSVGAGAFINDPTAPLLTISNFDRVWVTAQVPETLVGGITRGQSVEISLPAYPGQTLRGSVGDISPLLEPDTRRVKVRIEFANPTGRLKPNMFATALFAMPAVTGVSVPNSALLMNNDATTVFVEVAPWNFVRRTVELGTEEADTVRIVSGLKSGERVITRGGVLLND